jgi:hypothetical protein
LQGIFAVWLAAACPRFEKLLQYQSFVSKFPAMENWEFGLAMQGNCEVRTRIAAIKTVLAGTPLNAHPATDS